MPKPSWATLSVAPAETIYHVLIFAACAAFFLVVYELAARFQDRPWIMVLPLAIIAAAESGLGLAQAAASPDAIATGTYSIRNHYAGLLEMILPFAVAYVLASRSAPGQSRTVGPALRASIALALAILILSGIVASLSRMGFIASIAAVGLVALAAVSRASARRWRLAGFGAVTLAAVLAILFIPSTSLIKRFGETNSLDRTPPWRDTLKLIAAYPVAGCGLGGYESAFVSFKTSNPALDQDYAHNDYLQYLAELGIIGFAIAIAPLAIIVARLRHSWRQPAPEVRWLAAACAASALAIGLHSLVDFNLYVPANLLVFAWILGMAAHLGDYSARVSETRSTLTEPLILVSKRNDR